MGRRTGKRVEQRLRALARRCALLGVLLAVSAALGVLRAQDPGQGEPTIAELIERLTTTDPVEAETAALALLEIAAGDGVARANLRDVADETVETANPPRPTARAVRASRILYWADRWPSSSLRRGVPELAALMVAEAREANLPPGATEEESQSAERAARDAHLLRYAITLDALVDAPMRDAPALVVAFACDPYRPHELDALCLVLRAEIARTDEAHLAWGAPEQSLRGDVMGVLGQPVPPTDDDAAEPARSGLLAPAPSDGTVLVALSVLAEFEPVLARATALRWCFDPGALRRRVAWLHLARGPADLDLPFWRDRYSRELDAGVREAQLWALTRAITMPLDTASLRALQRELADAIPREQSAGTVALSDPDAVRAYTLPPPQPADALVEALRVVARLGAGFAVLSDDAIPVEARAAIAPAFWHDAARAEPSVLIDVIDNAAAASQPLTHRRLVTRALAALIATGGAEAVLHSVALPTSRERGGVTIAFLPSGTTVRDACLRIRADTGVDVLADPRYPGVGYRRIAADLRARNVGEALALLCEICGLRVTSTEAGRIALAPANVGPDGVAWSPDPGSPPWLHDALGRNIGAMPARGRDVGESEPWTFTQSLAAWSEVLDATVVCPLHLRSAIDNRVRAADLAPDGIALPGRSGRPLRTELPEVLRPLGLDVVTRGPAVWIGTPEHVSMWKAVDAYRRSPSPAALADLARSPACRWRVLTATLPDFAIEAAASATRLKPPSSAELAFTDADYTDPRHRPLVFEFVRLAHIRSDADAEAWWRALRTTRLIGWTEAATAALASEFADNGQIAWLRGDACASMRHLLPHPPAMAYTLESIDEPRGVTRRGATNALRALGRIDPDRLWDDAGPALFWLERKHRDGLARVLAPTATRARLTRLVRRYLDARALVLNDLAEQGIVITRANEQDALTALDIDRLSTALRDAGLSVGEPRSTVAARAVIALATPVDPERPPLQLVAPALSTLAAAALTNGSPSDAPATALQAMSAPVALQAGPLTLGLAARLVGVLTGVPVAVGVTTAEVWREYPPAANTVEFRAPDARRALHDAFAQLEPLGQPHRPPSAVAITLPGEAGSARLFVDLPDAAGPPVLVNLIADLWPTMHYRARTDTVATLWQQTGARSVHRMLLLPGRRNRPDVDWAPTGTPQLRRRLTTIARSGGVVAESPTAEPPANRDERAMLTSMAFRLELRLAALVGSPFAQRHFPLLDWADVKYGDRLTMGKPRFRSSVFSQD